MSRISKGTVIQFPPSDNWYGAMFGLVSEARPAVEEGGPQLLIVGVPIAKDGKKGVAPLRAWSNEVAVIGRAKWIGVG
jgi:hypothetical protein